MIIFSRNLINESLNLVHLIFEQFSGCLWGFKWIFFTLVVSFCLFGLQVLLRFGHGPDIVLDIWHSLVNWTTHFFCSLRVYSLMGQLDKYIIQCDKCSDKGSTSALLMFCPPPSYCSCCDIRDLFLQFKMFSQLSLSLFLRYHYLGMIERWARLELFFSFLVGGRWLDFTNLLCLKLKGI